MLFERWTEYSAFSPGMEVMSQMNLGPWDYGDEALRVFRKYSVLHMSLFPYRYAAAQESARDGMPMMRALVLMHQDDPEARAPRRILVRAGLAGGAGDECGHASARCICPKARGSTTGPASVSRAGETVVADAPLDRIPLYVREGAILPRIPEDMMTLVPQAEVKDPR